MKRLLTGIVIVSAALTGCATKYYGRANELTSDEKSTLSCPEIDIEMAKLDNFQQRIAEQNRSDGRSALSFAMHFGIGNTMDRDAAIKSANDRRHQLDDLRVEKGCADRTPASARTTAPVIPASAPLAE